MFVVVSKKKRLCLDNKTKIWSTWIQFDFEIEQIGGKICSLSSCTLIRETSVGRSSIFQDFSRYWMIIFFNNFFDKYFTFAFKILMATLFNLETLYALLYWSFSTVSTSMNCNLGMVRFYFEWYFRGFAVNKYIPLISFLFQ